LAAGLCAVLAACESTPAYRPPVTILPPQPRPVIIYPPPVAQTNVPAVRPPQPAPPPFVVTPPRPVPPKPPVLPPPAYSLLINGAQWVSLEAWGLAQGPARFARLGAESDWTYRLQVNERTFDLKADNRVAFCEGSQIWLGYAPKLMKGHLYIHPLDIQKNLGPILAEIPVRNRVVVIDPGHGGENRGTQSIFNKAYEKEYTLDWALRLKPLLEAKGWKVHLTRTRDTTLSLPDRVAYAEKVKANLFISLHFNSAGSEHTGMETYCITPVGMASHMGRGADDDVRTALPNNAHDTANIQYAARVHSAMVGHVGMIDRGVRRVRFMAVLKGQKRPALLLEGGYLSNAEEARLIAMPEYRQKLAEGVARALP
jgi:N-acetylmuramoyl-L-alanine amidase